MVPPIVALSKNNVSPAAYPDPPSVIVAAVTDPPLTVHSAVAPSQAKELVLSSFTLEYVPSA